MSGFTPGRWCRQPFTLLWVALFALLAGGCAASAPDESNSTAAAVDASPTATPVEVAAADAEPTATPAPSPTPSSEDGLELNQDLLWYDRQAEAEANPYRDLVSQLPDAPSGDSVFGALPEPVAVPVGLRIEQLGIDSAPVVDVGVNPDQSFEVPPAEEVGWYRFGPTPGEPYGSAVLAAHIAFDGVDGVFRNLVDIQPGAEVEVVFDDGSTRTFRVETVTEHDKQELPDSTFAKDGRPQLALITCGGIFDYEESSYESNIVAVAVPIEDGA